MSGWDRTDMGSDGHGIGRTWDRTDMGSDGHGIPSGIDMTFRGIPPGNDPYPLISEG